MSRAQTKQSFKLQLLALVLALALLWYSINPAPRPVIRMRRESTPPDDERRNRAPQGRPTINAFGFKLTGSAGLLPSPSDVDELDWPEIIDG